MDVYPICNKILDTLVHIYLYVKCDFKTNCFVHYLNIKESSLFINQIWLLFFLNNEMHYFLHETEKR